MNILVVGAGPAGTRCATLLAERLAAAGVTLVGEEAVAPYDRVALGKLLTGTADLAALTTHTPAALAAAGVTFRPGQRIARIDRDMRQAIATDGTALPYDVLVLATGSRAVRLPLPGAERAVLYRDIVDVDAMRAAAAEGGAAAVIGGGLLGLEAAAGLLALGMTVTVIHPMGWPMERQLDDGAGARLAATLQAQGLRFAMPAATAAIEAEGVRLKDGALVPARLVVLAVGVRPETTLAREAGLPAGRGILVDNAMRTADPAIFAIGECAEHDGEVCGLVAPALAQAAVAAAAIAGEAARYAPRPDAAALKVSGIPVWSAGAIAAADAEAITLACEESGEYRRLWLRGDKLVGAVLFGQTDDSGFYLDLISSGRAVPPLRAALALGPEYCGDAA
ncbi:NAD(P)/FAD-dependent oxidoreductase [Roseomonas elaeocarpi]|uniref:NAD(P)/FAD-dependent oxidoreductase n=1 Tax=Roseomonas elaeocarpi TaxID=907779 RepID=A0ABV6JN85_9PROT